MSNHILNELIDKNSHYYLPYDDNTNPSLNPCSSTTLTTTTNIMKITTPPLKPESSYSSSALNPLSTALGLTGITGFNNPTPTPPLFHSQTLKCRIHKLQSIVYICTSINCEKTIECAQCCLENPNHLIQHKNHIQPLGEFVNEYRYCHLEIKIENEFDHIIEDFIQIIHQLKSQLKNLILTQCTSTNTDTSFSSSLKQPPPVQGKLIPSQLVNKLMQMTKQMSNNKIKLDNEIEFETKILNFINHNIKTTLDNWHKDILNQIKTILENSNANSIVNQSINTKPFFKQSDTLNQKANLSGTLKLREVLTDISANIEENLCGLTTNNDDNDDGSSQRIDMTMILNNTYEKGLKPILSKNIQATLARDPLDEAHEIEKTPTKRRPNPNNIHSYLPRQGLRMLNEFPKIDNKSIVDTIKAYGPYQITKTLLTPFGDLTNSSQKLLNTKDLNTTTAIPGSTTPSNNGNDSGDNSTSVTKYGPLCLENGDIYEGEWYEQKRWGYGKLLSHLGFYYEGFWKKDLANGKGRMINTNGDMYEGDWVNGKYDGKGMFIGINGYKYNGDWLQDMQHGTGREIWPDGSSYEGEYKWSKKNGKGIFKWANGEKFTGEFYMNNLHGNGIYEWPNGQKYIGIWKENKICGDGRLEHPKVQQTKANNTIEKKIFASPDCATFKRNNNGDNTLKGEEGVLNETYNLITQNYHQLNTDNNNTNSNHKLLMLTPNGKENNLKKTPTTTNTTTTPVHHHHYYANKEESMKKQGKSPHIASTLQRENDDYGIKTKKQAF